MEGDFKFVCNYKTICTCLFHNMWFHKVSWELKVNWGVRLYARWLRFCWTCYCPMSMNIEIQNQQITCKSCHSLVLAYCKLLFLVEVKRVGCSIIFTRITITKPPQSLSLQIKQEVLILWNIIFALMSWHKILEELRTDHYFMTQSMLSNFSWDCGWWSKMIP